MKDDFDAKAASWDEDPVRTLRAHEVARVIKAHGQHPEIALEFGCGTGLLTFALRPFADQTTLADTSAGMVEVLTQKIEAQGASEMTPLLISEDGSELAGLSFDAIYTVMTLHHIDDTLAALKLLQKHLKPNGRLYLCDLEEEDGSFHGGGFSGHCGFNRASLTAQLTTAGFKEIRFEHCHTVEKEVDGKLTDFPLFLATATV